MSLRSRVTLLAIAAVLFCMSYSGSRAGGDRSAVAAVSFPAPADLPVRVVREGVDEGVFLVAAGSTVADVMKLTRPRPAPVQLSDVPERRLIPGDVISLKERVDAKTAISLVSMSVREKVAMGIPLDPDSLTAAEWEALPGIGPATAAAIVADRQENGDFNRYEELARVPGMGEKRVAALRGFFVGGY